MLYGTDGIYLDYFEHEVASVIPNAAFKYALDDASGAESCTIGWHLRRGLCQML
jgi:hypothetical protein